MERLGEENRRLREGVGEKGGEDEKDSRTTPSFDQGVLSHLQLEIESMKQRISRTEEDNATLRFRLSLT